MKTYYRLYLYDFLRCVQENTISVNNVNESQNMTQAKKECPQVMRRFEDVRLRKFESSPDLRPQLSWKEADFKHVVRRREVHDSCK